MKLVDIAEQLIDACAKGGAEGSWVEVLKSRRMRVGCCQGKIETEAQRHTLSLGLTLLHQGRCVTVSGQSYDKESLQQLVAYAYRLAQVLPEDPWQGMASQDQLAQSSFITSETLEDSSWDTICHSTRLKEVVTVCEASALEVEGVVISEGADISLGNIRRILATSQGRYYESQHTIYSLGASVVAQDSEGRYRGSYDHASSRLDQLEAPQDIGRMAGQRAAVQRGGRPLPFASRCVPVVYDPEAGVSLVEHALQALSGQASVETKTFWLKSIGDSVWPPDLSLWEDPCHPMALVPRSWDGEGLPARRQAFIHQGVLQSLLLDLATSRRLGFPPTGNGGSPLSLGASVGTVVMEGGKGTVEALMADIKEGLYVTQLMGQGVNVWTGDYSRGAVGFWIHEGQLAYPLKGATIAGCLPDMFKEMKAAADIRMRESVFVPTLCLQGMQVSLGA